MGRLILVIEDEPGIADFLERGLSAQGYQVSCALDGEAGLFKALKDDVDLVVLDLMLPGRSGLEILSSLRERKPGLPVIVLTARAEVEQRVRGLDAGAVDYLTKPFSISELAARVRAQLRVAAQVPRTKLQAGDIEVDLLSREVRRDDRPVRLSSTEFELLVYLMRNRGHVLSRPQILRAVWGYEYDPGTNVVDVYIGYLRRKLRRRKDGEEMQAVGPGDGGEATVQGETPISTVRSVGYRFDATS